MNKDLLKYLNRDTNALLIYDKEGNQLGALGREITPTGIECLNISLLVRGELKPLYPKLWFNPNEKIPKNEKPKNTGGKKPYLMLMIDEIEELRNEVKNVEELIGYVACLGKYIEWNTGKLINKRSKKPLKYIDLLQIYKCSNNKLNKMIKLMKDHDLLYYTDEGYFISQRYIKKGKSK